MYEQINSSQVTVNPVYAASSHASTSTTNSITVSSVYNVPISSGQVSILTSGGSTVTSQTIPVESSNQVSISDSVNSASCNLATTMGSGEYMSAEKNCKHTFRSLQDT